MFCPASGSVECQCPSCNNRFHGCHIHSNSQLSSRSNGLRRQRSTLKQYSAPKESANYMWPPHGGIPDWQAGPAQCVSWLQDNVLAHLERLDRKLDDIAIRLDAGGAPYCEEKQLREVKLDARALQTDQIDSKQLPAAAVSDGRMPQLSELSSSLLSKPSTSLSKRMPCGDTMVDLVNSPPLEIVRAKNAELELDQEGDLCRQLSDSTRTPHAEEDAEGCPVSPSVEETQWGAVSSLDTKASLGSQLLKEQSEFGSCCERLWKLFEDPESSRSATVYSILASFFTLASVCFTLMQSLPSPPVKGINGTIGEIIVEATFLTELLVRFATCPCRRTFLTGTYNLIDACVVVPLTLRCIFLAEDVNDDGMGGLAQETLLCIVPVLRLLKIVRRFERFQLLMSAFEIVLEALPVCLFPLAFITLLFSAAIYLVEPRDNIPTLWHAMWLTIVTMTTVGYGDITPSQAAGSIVVSLLVMSSVLYMAMPLGIIGQAFTQVWHDRDRILLIKRAKESLRMWGYKPSEIPLLFELFDQDGNGELELAEFQEMMAGMRIGLSQERVLQMFVSIDVDRGGSVDSSEFLNFLFPGGQYLDICGEDNTGNEKP